MSIYTRSGDDGLADLPGGRRVPKGCPLLAALAALDELGAHVGLCIEGAREAPEIADALRDVPEELLRVGTIVAREGGTPTTGANPTADAVARVEAQIDAVDALLPALNHWLLPVGCELTCRLHVARAVCRRAEGAVVTAREAGTALPPAVLAYLNRLGDLLFVLARDAGRRAGRGEQTLGPEPGQDETGP